MITLPATAQLDIYNMALGHVGVAPCKFITEGSAQSNACNQFWNSAMRDVLSNIPWNFNTVLATLPQNTTYQILNNWAYAYTYPDDCIRLWKVMAATSGSSIVGIFPGIYPNSSANPWSGFNMNSYKFQVRYDKSSDKQLILTNANNAVFEYSTNNVDPLLFDSTFITAASLCLATYIATPLVNDDQKTERIVKTYKGVMSEAMRLNSEEGNIDQNAEQSDFLDARGGGGPVSPQFWNSPSTSQY